MGFMTAALLAMWLNTAEALNDESPNSLQSRLPCSWNHRAAEGMERKSEKVEQSQILLSEHDSMTLLQPITVYDLMKLHSTIRSGAGE